MNIQHQFIDKSFSPHQLEKMKQGNSDSKGDYEFLTQLEFNRLRNMCLSIKEWPEKGKVSNYKGFSIDTPVGKLIQKMLNDKLTKWIGPHHIDFITFNEALEPWKVHADLRWHETKIPYKMILIPLDVEDASNTSDTWTSTYTISFDQRNYLEGSANTGKTHAGNDGPYATTGKTRICDEPGIHHLKPGYHITHEDHDKYMSHFPYDHLESLTINYIFEWKPRSAIYWDNNQIHCADNFTKRGIKTKRCLMICTLL